MMDVPRIESLKASASPTFQAEPVYLGLHEGNDQDRHSVAMANDNNDIGEYWKLSDIGGIRSICLTKRTRWVSIGHVRDDTPIAMTH